MLQMILCSLDAFDQVQRIGSIFDFQDKRFQAGHAALQRIHGLGDYMLSRYGDSLLRVVRDGLNRPLPAFPPYRSRPESMLDEAQRTCFDALRAWRAKVADQRGVTLDIVLNSATLIEIAKLNPRSVDEMAGVAGMTRWKRGAYGEDILRVLHAR